MDNPEKYVTSNNMQYSDASIIIEEYANEVSNMHGMTIDIGCGPGNVTKNVLLPKLPSDAVVHGK